MRNFINDLSYGCRVLANDHGLLAVAIIALALGVGANTAMFSLVSSALFTPYPFREPDRVVTLYRHNAARNITSGLNSYPNLLDFQSGCRSIESMAVFMSRAADLTDGDAAEEARVSRVSASFFPTLGVRPALGRAFLPEEDRPGAAGAVALLSHAVWQRRYGGDRSIIGKSIALNGEKFNVIGVLPPSFRVGFWTGDLYIPLGMAPDPSQRGRFQLQAVARLKPGVSLQQAQAEADAAGAQLERHPGNQGWRLLMARFTHWEIAELRPMLWFLLGASGLVLLIACVNVANILLARAEVRRREMAIRAAVGARRGRLIRQLLTEHLILGMLGGAAGVLLAYWTVDAVAAVIPKRIPFLPETKVDAQSLVFAAAVSLLTGLLFGLVPAFRASRADLGEALKEGGQRTGQRRSRLRNGLVIAEVSLSLALLIGAGLLVRGLQNLESSYQGFDPTFTATLIKLPDARYKTPEQRAAFFGELESRLRAVPGVQAAASAGLPLAENFGVRQVTIAERAPDSGRKDPPQAGLQVTTAGYFQIIRATLAGGRLIDERDSGASAPVGVINQAMAARYFGKHNPVGQLIEFDKAGKLRPVTVVGVVQDMRYGLMRGSPPPMIYVPMTQHAPQSAMFLSMRSSAEADLPAAARAAVKAMDPQIPVTRIDRFETVTTPMLAPFRIGAWLMGIFALLALVLAAVGIYGVISYNISGRTAEIGVRMALGAARGRVLLMVMRQAFLLICAGVALGLGLALGLTRILSRALFGVSPTDPLIFAGVTAFLALVALAASFIPARRATLVEPLQALRHG